MISIENFYGVERSGENKGRVFDIDLARDLAYASKPFQDAYIAGGDEAVDKLVHDATHGFELKRRDLYYRPEDIPAKRVYEDHLSTRRGMALKAIVDSRSKL